MRIHKSASFYGFMSENMVHIHKIALFYGYRCGNHAPVHGNSPFMDISVKTSRESMKMPYFMDEN